VDRILDIGLPGLVFLALCVWLVRKAVKAARTERDLEGEHLEGKLAEELRAGKARAASQRPGLSAVPDLLPGESPRADLGGAAAEHGALVAALVRQRGPGATLLWVRSSGSHVAWCERRGGGGGGGGGRGGGGVL
jgi:hypothetical protein